VSDATLTRGRAEAVDDLTHAWASKPGLPGFLSAVNHKQIGMRFIWTAIAFLVIGGVEGLLVRLQLSRAEATVLDPELYNQMFTMHGTTMMFLFAVPVLEGLAMYLAPLQVGTRDMPFPRLNAFGYWVYLFGGILLNWSWLTGSVPSGGWFAYTPLSGPEFTPDRSLDFWLLGVTFVEIAGIVGAIELIVVVLRCRAPGMSLGRVPLFSWSVLVMGAMMLVAFPFVIAASTLLEIERKFGATFFDAGGGGDPLLWQHLFWIFGHPEVYIMLLPATGIVSAVVAAHARRPIVAYPLVVAALIAIGIVSFGLWVHHMFAVGLPVLVLSLFAVASYFIAVPSGIQVFAWIATMWEGRPRWRTPLWFVGGFLFIFVLGGITGVMVATAPFDLQAHDSFFVVAHLHYVLIGGVVFPVLAGLHHWFPKLSGRRPSEVWGKVAFWLMLIGFNVTFMPQHWLGLQGMARRVYTYDADLGWDTSNTVSTVGAFVLAAGVAVFLANLGRAWRWGPPSGDDPWRADSLEWAVSSPPPQYNFERIPLVGSRSPLWDAAPHGFEPDVAQGVLGLSRPYAGRREIVRTSMLDARPQAIAVLPGPSYGPFVTALALTVAIVGILVDWWVLAGIGGVATLAALVGWLTGDRRRGAPTGATAPGLGGTEAAEGGAPLADPPATSVRDEQEVLAQAREQADRAFAAAGPTGRPIVVTGVIVGMIGVAHIVGAFVYSYFYVRLGTPEWPPPGTDLRGWALPAVALALVAATVPVASGRRRAPVTLTISALLGAAALAVQVGAIVESGYALDANAYEGLVLVLEGVAAVLLAAGVLVRLTVVGLLRRAPGDRALLEADGAVWVAAVATWTVLWAVLHVAPRWV
jgi:cytochrome c oxidase subunit I+III